MLRLPENTPILLDSKRAVTDVITIRIHLEAGSKHPCCGLVSTEDGRPAWLFEDETAPCASKGRKARLFPRRVRQLLSISCPADQGRLRPHRPTEKIYVPAAMEALTCTTFRLKEGRLFGFVSDNPPKAVIVDGQPVSSTVQDGYYTAVCSEPGKPAEVSAQF